MKVVYKLFIYCFLSVMFVSCSQIQSSSELESSFLSLISADMNNLVRIYPENSRAAPFKYGSDISLIFENLSDQKLFFDTDNFVRLYVVRDSQWFEIRNNRTYSGELLLFPMGTPLLDNNSVKVRPVLDNIPAIQNSDDFLRVVVVGEILRDDVRTGQLAGAYVDVMIEQE